MRQRDRNRIGYTSAMHTNSVESGSREGKQDSNTVTRSQELHTREHVRVVPYNLKLLCYTALHSNIVVQEVHDYDERNQESRVCYRHLVLATCIKTKL